MVFLEFKLDFLFLSLLLRILLMKVIVIVIE